MKKYIIFFYNSNHVLIKSVIIDVENFDEAHKKAELIHNTDKMVKNAMYRVVKNYSY